MKELARVLVTGATGYIGSVVAEAIAVAGHEVHGLVQSQSAAAGIEERGWRAARGNLRDASGLRAMAGAFGAVVHVGNVGGAEAGAVDVEATRALLRGMRPGSVFIYTSGVWVLGAGVSDESSAPNAPELVHWRPAVEAVVLGQQKLRGVVVRPGIVYGRGGGIPRMLAAGKLPLIGDGLQRWPLVHVEDLADLFVRALSARHGSVLHGVASTMSMRDVALLASGGMRAVRNVPLEVARASLGAFADALALDQQVSSDHTRRVTGWDPHRPTPVEEFLAGSYAGTRGPEAA